MPTNQDIWGQSSDWTCPVSGMSGSNNDMKPLVGYFGEAPSNIYPAGSLFSGIYHDVFPTINNNTFTDEPIDNSISYCGLGNESVWSRVQYYQVGPATYSNLTNSDNRSVTNFAFCNQQSSSYVGLYYLTNTDNPGQWKLANRCRWAPMGYNLKDINPTAANTNRNRNVVPYVQLPVRNMVLTATLRVAKQLTEDRGTTTGMDIANVPLWDYMDTTKTRNYTTHPYILAISIQPYMIGTDGADNVDPVTGEPPSGSVRSSLNVYSGISILSPLSYADGTDTDTANPGQRITDAYSYYWSRGKSSLTGVWIFGKSTTGLNDNEFINCYEDLQPYLMWTLPHPYAELRSMEQTNDYGWYYLEYYDNGEDDNLVHWIMEQMACFGLFFTIDKATAQNGALNDENMCLGVLEDGIGHGKWVSGEENMEQEQWEWDTTNSSSYKPHDGGGGDIPVPDPDANPITPHQPGFSLAYDNGSVCYTINKTEYRRIWNDIYNGNQGNWKDLINGLALYGANPLNAILNYRWYPFTLGGTATAPLRLGSTIVQPRTDVYTYISSNNEAFYSASGTFWYGRPKNFINSRKTKCRVWLPFYGYYELPMS